MEHPAGVDRDPRAVNHHSQSVCPALEGNPGIRRRPRTRPGWLVGLTMAAMMTEELDALATQSSHFSQRVEIGQTYTLKTKMNFTGSCDDSGCSSSKMPGLAFPDAILHIKFCGRFKSCSPVLTISGNDTFVSPITGTIDFAETADPPSNPEPPPDIRCENIRLEFESPVVFELVGPQ